VTKVTLPDTQTILTAYNGDDATVTDQVGRQRKSQVDGLGRLISVTEQDTATGSLSVATSYSYDTLDNLAGVNQGGQTRSFAYDELSRLTSQTTPEGGTVTYSYWDFDAVKKRTDARGVETHYKYDSLNRLERVWYTGLGGDDTGSIRPAMPAGVEATADVVMQYNTARPGNGGVSRVDDGAGYETYGYDSLGRNTSKSRVIDGYTFTTSYEYNQVSQQTAMIYPSGKRVRSNYDGRGRFIGLDKMSGTAVALSLIAVPCCDAGESLQN
jgi:YD repeat-containing protein